jgi:hypothetical protein
MWPGTQYTWVGGEHLGLDGVYLDEPAGYGAVYERAGAAPAMRIGVQVLLALDELALGLEPLDDGLVGVLDEHAGVVRSPRGELAFAVYRAERGHARALEGLVVVLAEARGRMHDARAVLGGNVVRRVHPEGALGRKLGEIGEEGLVARADQPRP